MLTIAKVQTADRKVDSKKIVFFGCVQAYHYSESENSDVAVWKEYHVEKLKISTCMAAHKTISAGENSCQGRQTCDSSKTWTSKITAC